jgi:hypothetical protein
MRTQRREFSIGVMLEIVRRATDSSERIHCEQCGAWLKSRKEWEIDHVISEGIRPAADKLRRLSPADGRLLCKAVCHSSKTKRDVGDIAEAKRREAKAAGLKRPAISQITGRPKAEKKPLTKIAIGPTGIARRFPT